MQSITVAHEVNIVQPKNGLMPWKCQITHLPLDKMADILADNNFRCLNENYRIPIRISLNFVPRSPSDKKPALAQVMAWHRTGHKLLPEPMLTQIIDTYMQH